MSEFKFLFHGESFRVGRLVARQVSGVLAHDGQIAQLSVRSRVTADVFRMFVWAVEGESNELTNEMLPDFRLSVMSLGFGVFRDAWKGSRTRHSIGPRSVGEDGGGIEAVLGRVALLEADVTVLRSTGDTVATPTLTRLEAELRIVKDSTSPLPSDVTHLKGKMNDFPVAFSARRSP
jgi:hypothetical protein